MARRPTTSVRQVAQGRKRRAGGGTHIGQALDRVVDREEIDRPMKLLGEVRCEPRFVDGAGDRGQRRHHENREQ